MLLENILGYDWFTLFHTFHSDVLASKWLQSIGQVTQLWSQLPERPVRCLLHHQPPERDLAVKTKRSVGNTLKTPKDQLMEPAYWPFWIILELSTLSTILALSNPQFRNHFRSWEFSEKMAWAMPAFAVSQPIFFHTMKYQHRPTVWNLTRLQQRI